MFICVYVCHHIHIESTHELSHCLSPHCTCVLPVLRKLFETCGLYMVVAWLGLCFVSAKHSLTAHKVMPVVPNLAQDLHVHHTEPHTRSYTEPCIYMDLIYAILCHAFCMTHHCQLLR